MILVSWLALAAAGVAGDGASQSRDGALRSRDVAPPRIDARVVVDGVLDEPVWEQAAVLRDFWQLAPVDGRPAEQETEVRVWYSPTALHFGVRARAVPGSIRARLAERDRGLIPDDYIEIQLGTFNDGLTAFVFAVNPLGVQADGALVEGAQSRRAGASDSERASGREQADLSPDYTFDSAGRVVADGYEIEIRIPFRSLRYQRADPQDWSLQIIRKSAASGREDTWTPVRRDAASFIAQHGRLVGLTGLTRGLVLEVNPIVTSTVAGAPGDAHRWRYRGGEPEVGGNVKWGLTTNLTLNGTLNPDFSQVESDAGQLTPDPRRAVFFAEKRPFFLDGLEYFSTPSQVIYTRRIVSPVAAAKVTGKVSGTSFGLLSAVDGSIGSAAEAHPVFNLLRVQRDVGRSSRLGFAYTDRIDGGDYNRVGQVDGRLVFGSIYHVAFHGALSRTRRGDATATAPLWFAAVNRAGRTFGFQASLQGTSDRFEAASGFLGQRDLAQAYVSPSITLYGSRDALLERFTGSVSGTWTWTYDAFRRGAPSRDRQYWLSGAGTLRGGWSLGGTLFAESFGYDERLFREYAIEVPRAGGGADTLPFGRKDRLPSLTFLVRARTPEIGGVGFDGFFAWGKEVNYLEWSAGEVIFSRLGLTYRPTEKLRFESAMPVLIHRRWDDRSKVDGRLIPRLKAEYQVTRAVFVRLVGEYRSSYQADLIDDARTDAPILIRDPADGIYKRSLALGGEHNALRLDWLFSYQPTPGTVFFAGYGSSLEEVRAFRFSDFRRVNDGFFTKLSYLFRL